MSKNKKKILVILFFLVGIVLTLTFTYTKYVHNSVWSYYLESKGFYFSSDYLDIEEKTNTNLKWDGSNINFNIKNYLNEESVTSYDITYKVTCTVEGDASSYSKCVINDNEETFEGTLSGYEACINNTSDGVDVSEYNKKECNLNGYTWYIAPSDKELYFNVVSTDDTKSIEDVSVKIEVDSLTPYKQTLIGKFLLHKVSTDEDNFLYEYQNYTEYDKLVISNLSETDKCLFVKWDSALLRIDSNVDEFINYKTDEDDYINEITVKINSKKDKSLIFYRLDLEKTYTINDLTVIELDNCE